MLFNSLVFIFGFLPLTYAVFWLLKSRDTRYIWLTITSYVFYGFWDYRFCGLLALSTLISYLAGLGFLHFQDDRKRKFCLVLPIFVDLLLLGFFKYANFATESLAHAAFWFHVPVAFVHLNILLPLGISFYTFHTITYIVDAYNRRIKPTSNFFEFACYVSLFSQLVAGPIVRFKQIENDLMNIETADRTQHWEKAVSFFAIGMVEKVLIADNIGAIINPAFDSYSELSTLGAWLCILGYGYQLYFDFAGYSDMAVGLGHMFGLRIPQNFNSPYKALNLRDFWHRWHISLSTCLRDYLYIPFGGNRGTRWDTFRNMMTTMLIGGLWHGASWMFVVWGAYHGALLGIYKLLEKPWNTAPAALQRLVTFVLVTIGWVFFRCQNFHMAYVILSKLFQVQYAVMFPAFWGLLFFLSIAAVLAHLAPNTWEVRHDWRPLPAAALSAAFVLCLVTLYANGAKPFLYFQF